MTITKHRRAVARLVPVPKQPEDLIGALRGRVLRYGDSVSPIDEVWTYDEENILAGPSRKRARRRKKPT